MDHQYFSDLTIEEMPFAGNLGTCLMDMYNPLSVTDAGCATGLYLLPFFHKGITVAGIEINQSAFDLSVIPYDRMYNCDLQYPITMVNKSDLLICLEVLEHIPAEFAYRTICNLAQLSDTIIFTAAQPGQGGEGHINLRHKNYWEDLFSFVGMFRWKIDETMLLDKVKCGPYMGWFINNLMIFKRTLPLAK